MRTLKKALSLVLVLAMVLSLGVTAFAADAKTFKDYGDVKNKEAVDVMVAIDVISGRDNGTYDPTASFTRAEAATMIARLMLGKTIAEALPTGATQFNDVPSTHWAAKYIQYCANEGIINGYGEGKFGPDDKLTSTQWALMLLGALGYKAANENIGGAGWEIQVTKLAMEAKVASADELTAAFNRDMAAKMAFNTLKADMVWYDGGSTVTVNGVTFTSGATRKNVAQGSYAHYDASKNTDVADPNLQFCEKNYPDLKLTATGTTTFGRPGQNWTYKTNTNIAAAATPVATYTTAVEGKTVYADLGLTAVPTTVVMKVNGAATATIGTDVDTNKTTFFTATSKAKLGGNGIVTEVYKSTAANGDVTVTVIQTQYTLAYVNNVVNHNATSAKGAYTTYTLNNVQQDANKVYVEGGALGSYNVFSTVVDKAADKNTAEVSGTIAKGDYVLVVTDTTATVGTTYIYAVNTIEGALTASSASTYTIGGTAYPAANVKAGGAAVEFNSALYSATSSATFVVDSYGNVVAPVKGTAATPNYVYVAHQALAYTLTGTTLKQSITAYVVDTEGKIDTMSVTKVGTTDVTSAGQLADGLYTYKLNSDGETYTFTSAGNALSGASFDYKTSAVLTGSVYGNANTVFYTITTDKVTTSTTFEQPVSVTTTTGMSKMGNMTGVNGAYVATNNVANYVFIVSGSATAANKVVYYNNVYSFDGTDYVYNVVVNGADDTVKNVTGFSGAGLYEIGNDNAATKITASAFASHTGKYVEAGKIFSVTNNGGLLTVVTTTVADGTYTTAANIDTIADNVPVYVISAADGTCQSSTADGLSVSGASVLFIQANAGGTAIGAIYAVVD